jgi:Uma2 family endonuclease
VPPLQPGDHLSRDEFERRYKASPHIRKAELIEGIVFMPPPVSQDDHSGPHFDLIGWLGIYRAMTPGIRGGDNGTIRLDLDSEPQPDAFLYILPSHGGQARIDPDGYVAGAPEFVAEVSASSVSYDLHSKKRVYLRNKVQEYLVCRIFDRAVDWFVLQDGDYVAIQPDSQGLYWSQALPGLCLDAAALLQGELLAVIQQQQQALNDPRHAAFIAKLTAAKGATP